jgi:hypothetical protein
MYGMEQVIQQILNLSDLMIYSLCVVINKAIQTWVLHDAVQIQNDLQLWEYLQA